MESWFFSFIIIIGYQFIPTSFYVGKSELTYIEAIFNSCDTDKNVS